MMMIVIFTPRRIATWSLLGLAQHYYRVPETILKWHQVGAHQHSRKAKSRLITPTAASYPSLHIERLKEQALDNTQKVFITRTTLLQ
uniref:Uncharacterized protein n=1 Tax=Rhizophora mucronata TaxID=61149 RepID=A0A2P2LQE8_RHIMU